MRFLIEELEPPAALRHIRQSAPRSSRGCRATQVSRRPPPPIPGRAWSLCERARRAPIYFRRAYLIWRVLCHGLSVRVHWELYFRLNRGPANSFWCWTCFDRFHFYSVLPLNCIGTYIIAVFDTKGCHFSTQICIVPWPVLFRCYFPVQAFRAAINHPGFCLLKFKSSVKIMVSAQVFKDHKLSHDEDHLAK